VLDVLTEAFMNVWLTLAAGQAPYEEHPDAPEAGRNGIFGESGALAGSGSGAGRRGAHHGVQRGQIDMSARPSGVMLH
jgi:hypothetical protein